MGSTVGLFHTYHGPCRPTMESARYGADLDESLFKEADACGWNTDRLDSCLQLLRVDAADGDEESVASLPGVTSAYLYVGMWARHRRSKKTEKETKRCDLCFGRAND